MKEFSYRVEEALQAEVGQQAFDDLLKYLELLESLRETACKETHYEKLDEWNGKAYGFVHDMLKKHRFINGGAAMGLEQPRDANFWWMIYSVVSNVCYSRHLKTEVANHHASAWERNEALIADIRDIIEFKTEETIK
jgi:hypothetical protein